MKRKHILPLALVTLGSASLANATEDFVMGVANTNPTRAVVGSPAEVTYRLFNISDSDINFTLTPQGNTGAVSGPASPILAGAPQTLNTYSFLANTSGLAGSTLTTGLTATEVLGVRTASATHNIQLLENRTINFSLSSGDKTSVGGVLDLGRFMSGQSVTLSMNGGTQSRDLATDVHYYTSYPGEGTYYSDPTRNFKDLNGATTGLQMRKSENGSYSYPNSSARTFNASNQSYTSNLRLFKTGSFSDTYNFGSNANLGTNFSAEAGAVGAVVNYGSPLTITGTGLNNRQIFATSGSSEGYSNNFDYYAVPGKLDSDAATGLQSRVMVGSVGNIAAGSETWTIASPGLDTNTARVNFTGSGVVTNGYLSVDTGAGTTSFDGTITRNITTTRTALTFGTAAGVNINTASAGIHTTSVNLTPNLSSGETGGLLSGQSLGSNLSVGYTFEVVRDRQIQVGNLNRTALTGLNVSLSNGVYGSSYNSTNPTANFQGGGSASFSSYTDTVYDNFNMGTGAGSGTRTVGITPEGLAGERAAYNLTYDWSLNRVNAATMQQSGNLANSGYLSVSRTDEVGYARSVGNLNWYQTNAGTGTASAAIREESSSLGLGDGWSMTKSGLNTSSASFGFSFDDTGMANGNYYMSYSLSSGHADQNIIGTSYADLGYKNIWIEAVVSGRVDTTAYKGFRLENFTSTAPPVVTDTVEGKQGAFRILDIVDTTQNRGVSMKVLSSLGSNTYEGQELNIVTGSIKGLDGLTFVLESTYDEDEVIALFGSEDQAILLWEQRSGVFVNAVIGNHGDAVERGINPLTGQYYASSIGGSKIGQRFVGSYADYLLTKNLTDPRLGDFGYDPVANTVWAVIDHNSSFGGGVSAIPEPSSVLLIFSGSLVPLLRRRRN